MPKPMMYGVWKEIEFDAGHRVPDHRSKCRNPHGHRYKVRALVVGPLQQAGSSNGMVIDFGDVKDALTTLIHDLFDHGFMVYKEDSHLRLALNAFEVEAGEKFKIITTDFVPTAENLAAYCYNLLWNHFIRLNISLQQVEVYETPTSVAVYPA